MEEARPEVQQAVAEFVRTSAQRNLGVEGVHAHVRGRAPVEWHGVADIRRDVFSVSKTFTSVAIGIAEGEGLLSVDDPVLEHLPGLAAAAAGGVGAVTIRHLLMMSSGLDWPWPDPDADHPGDPAVDFLATPPVAPPGQRFQYRGGSSYVLSRVIHACSGVDLRDYLLPRLFAPLGIGNPQWHRCPLGFPLGAVGLFLRTAEIARLGETLLDDGRYENKQLVPAEYVRALSADTIATDGHRPTSVVDAPIDPPRYGRHVWVAGHDGAWWMDGIYGQFCLVLPQQGACVTVTSHYEGPTKDILDAIWTEIVPALR